MRLLIINGPNLNLLGQREPDVYGATSFEAYLQELQTRYAAVDFSHFQSNVEGVLIDRLQQADGEVDGIILNAGGYTHTSVAIGDAIAAIRTPVVEVHISNVHARESYRHTSLLAKHCRGVITGFGLDSYRLAVESLWRNEE